MGLMPIDRRPEDDSIGNTGNATLIRGDTPMLPPPGQIVPWLINVKTFQGDADAVISDSYPVPAEVVGITVNLPRGSEWRVRIGKIDIVMPGMGEQERFAPLKISLKGETVTMTVYRRLASNSNAGSADGYIMLHVHGLSE